MRTRLCASIIAVSLGLAPAVLTSAVLTSALLTPALAQTAPDLAARAEHEARAPAKRPPRNKYGTPLDTLRSTHIYATVPEAEGFVRATRPDAKDLDYTPLTGTDPERPKPRDKANVAALQAELEHDGALAQAKGRPLRGGVVKVRKKTAE